MRRAILDTNVVLSGLRSRHGSSFELLRRLRAGHWRLVLSNTVLTEYEEGLKREAAALQMTLAEIDVFLDAISALAEPWTVTDDCPPSLADPDDESFVQLAAEARVDALAPFNVRHFAPARSHGIPVMTPAAFLAMLQLAP